MTTESKTLEQKISAINNCVPFKLNDDCTKVLSEIVSDEIKTKEIKDAVNSTWQAVEKALPSEMTKCFYSFNPDEGFIPSKQSDPDNSRFLELRFNPLSFPGITVKSISNIDKAHKYVCHSQDFLRDLLEDVRDAQRHKLAKQPSTKSKWYQPVVTFIRWILGCRN